MDTARQNNIEAGPCPTKVLLLGGGVTNEQINKRKRNTLLLARKG